MQSKVAVTCSVIIPNFNHESYLSERINTILCQENIDVEYIFLDDASTDSSVNVIANYLNQIDRFQFIRNTINSASTYSQWNLGVSKASNNILNIAESDDAAYPRLLSTLTSAILANNDIVLSFCRSNKIDSLSKNIGIWDYKDPIFETEFVMSGIEFIKKYLIHENVIPNASAVVFKKNVYRQVGSADIDLLANGDWLIWLKMLCHGNVYYTPQILNSFRKHDKSVTARNNSELSNLYKEKYSVTLRKRFRDYLKDQSNENIRDIWRINEEYISLDYGNMSLYYLNNQYYLQSFNFLLKSLFTGNLKTYFIKKYFLDLFSYMFKK